MESNWNLILFFVILFSCLLPFLYRTESEENKKKWYWHYLERLCYFSGLEYFFQKFFPEETKYKWYISFPERLVHYSGIRFIWRKFFPAKKDRHLPTGWVWLLGIYFAAYAFTSQRYESKLEKVEFRYNTFTTQVAAGASFNNQRLMKILDSDIPVKPDIFDPYSIFKSFYLRSKPDSKYGFSEKFFHSYDYKSASAFRHEIISQWIEKLNKANFEGAQIEMASFKGAQLEKANFFRAQLENADFRGAQLEMANFEEAKLTGSVFEGAQLKRADFGGTQLDRARFTAAMLERAYFFGAQLEEVDFYGAQLEKAYFFSAKLKGAVFFDSKLRSVDFYSAQLEGANFGSVKFLKAEQLIKAANIKNIINCPPEILEKIIELGCEEMLKKRPDEWSDEFKKHRQNLIEQWEKEEKGQLQQESTS
ncbi:MAG: pentapeptide repeat-containing protein [Desulfobacter sp.]|nr:MAG: pentapeptide repeat-containing protein [Desulfobacter sp.]